MLWAAWTSLIPTFFFLSAVVVWWSVESKNVRINLIAAASAALFCWAVAPESSSEAANLIFNFVANQAALIRPEYVQFVANNANMLLTGAAVVWLVRRAWQTLWKPVPELINILGVDVPDAPDVVLAGIRSDAAILHWTRPPAHRPVQKFLIQVNGVVVGDVPANQEPAIVVSGLKPNHYYNIRVIAVGSNNFQAGSKVVRIQTHGRDAKPRLGNGRLPSNFMASEPQLLVQSDIYDENGIPRNPVPALETAATPDGPPPSVPRDSGSTSAILPRRNTLVGRRHSPSTTSMEQSIREEVAGQGEQSLAELTERFESIRKETEETTSLIGKEEAESRRLLEELETEKLEKRKEQKKKEEQTERLRKEANLTERNMRNAMQRKAQREKQLKEKHSEREKYVEDIQKWERGIEEMRRDRAGFEQQKKELQDEREKKVASLGEMNRAVQDECARLEAELKEKREKVKELEDARKRLPGGQDDAEWREKDIEYKRGWQRTLRDLNDKVTQETRQGRRLDDQLRILGMQVQQMEQYGLYNHANGSGMDIENTTLSLLKRRTRTSNSLSSASVSSPLPAYSQIDPALAAAPPPGFSASRTANVPVGFAPGPFMDMPTDMPPRMDEASIRAFSASVPLSPSATALLPSSILDDMDDMDDDEPSPTSRSGTDPLGTLLYESPRVAPQSPASSGRSPSFLSSPRDSSLNLPFPSFPSGDNADRRSLHASGPMSSPAAEQTSTHHRVGGLFSFQRSRAAKGIEDGGPALGSLKQGQSQSFPRQTEDADANKRRISLSGPWNMFNRNSAGPDLLEGHASHSRLFSAKNLLPFSAHRTNSAILPERDPSSPRPSSIASSEYPRPSTDSGSIWGPPDALGKAGRLWLPEVSWSRNPSRRPSLHGSPSALETTLASVDDEILDEETLPNVSKVGVIGSRLPAQSKPLGRLNPAAPAFMGSLFRSKPDKDKENKENKESTKDKDKDKDKSKSKDKDRSKDKGKDVKEKSRAKDLVVPDTAQIPDIEVDSPSDWRQSRDAFSVHTLTSVSESRESLSLDQPRSNTPSEPPNSAKDKDENVVRKLFRKGSSGKFSLSGRLGGKDSGLFKKGSTAGSVTNSDRGMAAPERTSIGDLEELAAGDESAGSGLVGRSYDSMASSPNLGPVTSAKGGSKDGTGKTSARWLSNFSKKGRRDKESLELDRDKISVVSESESAAD